MQTTIPTPPNLTVDPYALDAYAYDYVQALVILRRTSLIAEASASLIAAEIALLDAVYGNEREVV